MGGGGGGTPSREATALLQVGDNGADHSGHRVACEREVGRLGKISSQDRQAVLTGGGLKKSEASGMTKDFGATHRRMELPQPGWGLGRRGVGDGRGQGGHVERETPA